MHNKADLFGTVLKLNAIEVPTQKDFNDFIIQPLKNHPFDSSIVTSYKIIQISSGKELQILPENLFKHLTYFIDAF